jgi:hypothetical protein
MNPATSITWSGTVTALTSIAHAGDTRGSISLLRRERVIQPDCNSVDVPIISGNSLRGRLRRIGEELLRDVLLYEGQLTASAAHALRSGGSLTKVAGEPLSGSRLAAVRAHLPLIGVFGAAAGGRIIDGCLDVGKLIPLVTETDHITGHHSTLSSFEVVQLEYYTRLNDADSHNFPATATPAGAPEETQMLYRLETFKAGTRFHLQINLNRPTPLEEAFFTDVLAAFIADARIGGRLAVGLGRAHVDLARSHPETGMDWIGYLRDHRDEAMSALANL